MGTSTWVSWRGPGLIRPVSRHEPHGHRRLFRVRLGVAGITSPRSSLSPLGGFPKPPSAPGGQHTARPGRRTCQPRSKTRTSVGTGSLKHMVLSIELLASLEGVVSLPDPTSHALATCPLGPWPDPQLHTGVTGAPHKLPWLPEAATQGMANPAPGWPLDKDHRTEPLSTPRGTTPAGWALVARAAAGSACPLGQPVLSPASPQSLTPGTRNPTAK